MSGIKAPFRSFDFLKYKVHALARRLQPSARMNRRKQAAELGRSAEDRAVEWWLARYPGRLIARNYRWQGGEVDLILEEPGRSGELELVFVEVRARTPGGWVRAEESITYPKQRRLLKTIERFLAGYRGPARTVRIDVLAWNGPEGFMHLRGAL
jgi:putative endonuclease